MSFFDNIKAVFSKFTKKNNEVSEPIDNIATSTSVANEGSGKDTNLSTTPKIEAISNEEVRGEDGQSQNTSIQKNVAENIKSVSEKQIDLEQEVTQEASIKQPVDSVAEKTQITTSVASSTVLKKNSGDKVIAIDGMGGDAGPEAIMKGVGRFNIPGFHFIIFGDKAKLSEYKKFIPEKVSYEIRHTDVVITSDMEVISALRIGKESSIGLALESVKIGESQAVISSGNTGAYMALSKIILKTIDGIERPAIASIIPGEKGRTVCLDLGANTECSVKNLVDFAILGEAVAASVLYKNDVTVALMNIGSEDIKGSKLIKKTSEILKSIFDNYKGYVEGDALCKGEVDVIVMDGFTGNVALKAIEGTAKYLATEIKAALGESGMLLKIAAALGASSFKKLKNKMDPRLYNGAILAGLNGVVVKSHGASDEIAFENAIKFTADILNKNIFARISEHINKTKLEGALNSFEEKGQK